MRFSRRQLPATCSTPVQVGDAMVMFGGYNDLGMPVNLAMPVGRYHNARELARACSRAWAKIGNGYRLVVALDGSLCVFKYVDAERKAMVQVHAPPEVLAANRAAAEAAATEARLRGGGK